MYVHPFLMDFGGGCYGCDRRKTKSTQSNKTEVWTLDWSLTNAIFLPFKSKYKLFYPMLVAVNPEKKLFQVLCAQ